MKYYPIKVNLILNYIGVNPNEHGLSVELIKRYADNVLIGIKLDAEGEYLYVSTMHDVQETKINMIVISMIIFEVGNGSRHTLKRVPEMMDTPPIQK